MCLFALAAPAAAAAGAGSMASIGTVLSTGLSIMQAFVGYQGQMAQYKAEVARIRREEEQAQKTLNQEVAQQRAALESEKDKAQGELADAAIKAEAAKSKASVESAESGVVGLSVAALTDSISAEEARFGGRVQYNTRAATYNAENELKMAQRGHAARLASIPIPVKPSFLPTAINIASSVVSGMQKYNSSQSRDRYGYT